ncbi:MAG: hypothetical protein HQ490_02605, partial [Lutibacter sp.]|nr:hypothetical protein [Lutibacter sp.]
MSKMFKKTTLLFLILATIFTVQSQTNTEKQIDLLHGVSISGDWFIAYSNTKKDTEKWENKFIV